ncbi:hypothetical protein RAS1_25520 [Phycisphaerae bacterium RAS1]|nr:hypothetical protein RAS1_25520 [Phycisphaerae bacterium RAS1]
MTPPECARHAEKHCDTRELRRCSPRASRRGAWLAFALLVLPPLAGCGTDATLEPEPYQTGLVESAGNDQVLAAAATILRREFGRLEQLDARAGRIVTAPAEFDTRNESGTARDFRGGSSRMRRVATLTLAPRAAGTLARLRIDIERQDTTRATQQQTPTGRFDDYPSSGTAIERDAATSDRQNSVWTRVRRDRNLERELLSELLAEFAPPESPAGGGK